MVQQYRLPDAVTARPTRARWPEPCEGTARRGGGGRVTGPHQAIACCS